jgi:hypothetical protein
VERTNSRFDELELSGVGKSSELQTSGPETISKGLAGVRIGQPCDNQPLLPSPSGIMLSGLRFVLSAVLPPPSAQSEYGGISWVLYKM